MCFRGHEASVAASVFTGVVRRDNTGAVHHEKQAGLGVTQLRKIVEATVVVGLLSVYCKREHKLPLDRSNTGTVMQKYSHAQLSSLPHTLLVGISYGSRLESDALSYGVRARAERRCDTPKLAIDGFPVVRERARSKSLSPSKIS